MEPAVGSGNFLPILFRKYQNNIVNLTIIDINNESLELLKILYENNIPENFKIKYVNDDYLMLKFNKKFDLIIGNPPFTKINKIKKVEYQNLHQYSENLKNLAGLFLEKSLLEAENISLIMPKNLLNTPEYQETRNLLVNFNISSIIDFGEKGFDDILIETINITISKCIIDRIYIKSLPKKQENYQFRDYIFSKELPYWVIYRDEFFDFVYKKMEFDIFKVFRDRQITNSILINNKQNTIRVLKSKNIDDSGKSISEIENYDSYILDVVAKKLDVYKYLDYENAYLTPNMTYKPRLISKPKGYLTNGSVAILIPKNNLKLNDKQKEYISTDEFRKFYHIARNYQTRSINIDSSSVFWFGKNKELN
ncbi:Eco57I restriction-modification methylase domain-containing protein [Mycoplasma sp. 246B]